MLRHVALVSAVVLVGSLLAFHMSATADNARRCDRHAAAAAARAAEPQGTGERVLVIGDSYTVGLGLERPEAAWTSRLPGRVHVAGFSGSGFSRGASGCGPDVSFADRAADAVRADPALVVVEGGLNDFDQDGTAIRVGFDRLMQVLEGRRVVVVGPVSAPARAARVPRVDSLLARLAAEHGVAYIGTTDLELDYLQDRLHLTPEGHQVFGDYVAEQLEGLAVG